MCANFIKCTQLKKMATKIKSQTKGALRAISLVRNNAKLISVFLASRRARIHAFGAYKQIWRSVYFFKLWSWYLVPLAS